jgi:uncharacterized protein YidB (DUF937 family)
LHHGPARSVAGSVLGQPGGGQHQNALLDLATSLIQNQPGGLAGLVEKFTSAGLGQQVASWVSTGQNLPISADDLLSALGRDNVQAASQKLGIPGATASGELAALLPALIDQLTPKGQIEQGDDLSAALSALRGKLGV